jgi:hypothetical protein
MVVVRRNACQAEEDDRYLRVGATWTSYGSGLDGLSSARKTGPRAQRRRFWSPIRRGRSTSVTILARRLNTSALMKER